MVNPTVILDRITLVTPLALSFWDPVSNAVIRDGLVVTAYPPNQPEQAVQASVNRLGIYTLRNLPGLRAVENGIGDAAFWINPPATRTFVVEVQDIQRRFQPFSLTLSAPVRGVFAWEHGTPESPPQPTSIPLFSAPARSVPAGMAAVRAELFDPIHQQPAAWAILQVRLAGQLLARGLADEAGRLVLIFPYPEPNLASHIPLTQQVWSLQLQAAYAWSATVPPSPDLEAALAQPSATLWQDSARSLPLTQANLSFGRELILRSVDSVSHQPLSSLLIT
jgi:hypothetical protein